MSGIESRKEMLANGEITGEKQRMGDVEERFCFVI